MSDPIDRFLLLIECEGFKMPWLEKRTGIDRKRWSNIKIRHTEMKATDLQALARAFPEYAYWLATGEELPEKGQISPMTKRAQQL